MKIITWNCNMAFRKKAIYILPYNPDILIIPECECIENLIFTEDVKKADDIYWFGENKHKGIGVFSYNGYKISTIEPHNFEFRYVIPLRVYNHRESFILIAVWAQKPKSRDNYGINVYNAINYYQDLFKNETVIIAGDFNSSSIWDKPNREANHSNIVRVLKNLKIESLYHLYYKEEQGKEKKPTLYFQKNKEKPFHIDYCFASEKLQIRLKDVQIGKYEEWTKYSDHKPLIILFKD